MRGVKRDVASRRMVAADCSSLRERGRIWTAGEGFDLDAGHAGYEAEVKGDWIGGVEAFLRTGAGEDGDCR